MLISREDIKTLQNMRNDRNKLIIDEIIDYFNNYVGSGYNTDDLVYLSRDLSEKFILIIENVSFDDLQKEKDEILDEFEYQYQISKSIYDDFLNFSKEQKQKLEKKLLASKAEIIKDFGVEAYRDCYISSMDSLSNRLSEEEVLIKRDLYKSKLRLILLKRFCSF